MVMADINIINEIKALCEKMDAQSRETLVISVGRAERNVLCHGSKLGHQFLLNDKQVCHRFVKFCEDVFSGAVAIKDNLDGEESIPVTTIDQILSSVVEGIQQYDGVIYKSRDITPENKTGRKSARCSASPKKVRIGAQQNLSLTSRIKHQKKQTAMKSQLYVDKGDGGVTRRSDEDEDDNIDGDEYTLEVSAEIEFKCEMCSKILRTKASLSRHQLLHSEKMESCKVCNKKFYRAEDITKHMKVHQSTDDKQKEKTSCHLCNRNFQRASSLKLHMKSAHKSDDCKVKGQTKQKKQFICNVCNVEFRHKFGLDRHMKSHENIRLFKCYVCNESFGTEKELQAHASSHQVMLIFKCVLCGSVLPTDEELKEHQMNSCSKNPHTNENNTATSQLTGCHSDSGVVSENPISEQVTVSGHFDNTGKKLGNMTPEKSESSAGHIPSETDNLFAAREDTEIESPGKSTVPQSHNPNGHKCDICNRCFKQPLALYKHKLHHDNFGMFSCRFCDYVTKSKDNLNRHSKKHLDVKPHTCSVCSKGFTEKHNLRLHMLTHTKERPHLCDICGKGFRTAQLLKRHKRVHTGERPYVCKQCGKSFMTAEVLRNHENIHNNFRGYICDVCGVAFNQKCSLYTHKHKHADKPSHICKECGKGCSSAASLKTHFVSKHLKNADVGSYGLKVYECDKCHKLFADKSDLNIHLRTHTGEKPFKCTYCEKAFADKSNLRTHEKIHLDVRPFSCDMCGKGFILKRDLLKHMKSHPNVEVQTQINRYHIEQSTLPIEEPGTILNPQISTLLHALPSYTEL